MKKEIHPKYEKVTFRCACGNTIETRSTLGEDMMLDICSSCHPFFTGKQKLVDTAGRIDRFKKKYGGKISTGKKPKKKKKPAPAEEEGQQRKKEEGGQQQKEEEQKKPEEPKTENK